MIIDIYRVTIKTVIFWKKQANKKTRENYHRKLIKM